MYEKPVMFPPGRARLATTPCLSGLPLNAMMIGIVVVVCLAAHPQGDDQIDLSCDEFGGELRKAI